MTEKILLGQIIPAREYASFILHQGETLRVIDKEGKQVADLVALSKAGLTTLDYVDRNETGGLALGSMVTLETLEKSPPVLNEYAYLAQAIRLVAIPSLRHGATSGGTLCLDTRYTYYNQSESWSNALKACFMPREDICHLVAKGRLCQAVHQGDLAPVLDSCSAAPRRSKEDQGTVYARESTQSAEREIEQ